MKIMGTICIAAASAIAGGVLSYALNTKMYKDAISLATMLYKYDYRSVNGKSVIGDMAEAEKGAQYVNIFKYSGDTLAQIIADTQADIDAGGIDPNCKINGVVLFGQTDVFEC